MEKLMAAIGVFFLAILIALIFGFLLAWVIMVLWNCLMPDIFNLPQINYWQAFGLYFLSYLLIKSSTTYSSK